MLYEEADILLSSAVYFEMNNLHTHHYEYVISNTSVFSFSILKDLRSNPARPIRSVKPDIEVNTRAFFQSYRRKRGPETIQLASDVFPVSQGV